MDKQKKIIIIALLVIVLALAVYFLFRTTPTEEQAKKNAEDAARQQGAEAAAASAANIAGKQAAQSQLNADKAAADAAAASSTSQADYHRNLRSILSDTTQNSGVRGKEAEFQRQQNEIDTALNNYRKDCADVDAHNEKRKQDIERYNADTLDGKFKTLTPLAQDTITKAVEFGYKDMYGGNLHDVSTWEQHNTNLADDKLFAYFKLMYDQKDRRGFIEQSERQNWRWATPATGSSKDKMESIAASMLSRAKSVSLDDLNQAYTPEPYPAKPQILIDNGL